MASNMIKLMVNRAPTNEIYKAPYCKRKHKVPCVFKEGTSSLRPHFIVQTNSVPKILDYNYCYSYDTKYDYYIEDKIMLPQGQVELVCRIDVLYTFRDALLELVVHEERSTEGESYLIADEQVPVMHNTIIDKVIPMDMRIGDEFTNGNQIIVTTMTANQFTYVTAPVTPQNVGVIGAWFSDKAYDIAYAITARALKYWDDYRAYVQTIKDYAGKGGEWNEKIYPINFMYAQDTSYKAPFYNNNKDGMSGFFDRYCTHYSEEQGSGLTYIDGTNYPNNTPQSIRDAKAVWSSWDCSQFAWRCARFNSEEPMNIANFGNMSSASGSNTSGLATSMGNKTVTFEIEDTDGNWNNWTQSLDVTDDIESEADLVKGDIIISGGLNGEATSYWVYEVWINGMSYWYSRAKRSGEQINNTLYDTLVSEHPNVDSITFIYGVNHARVYIGGGECIESVCTNMSVPRKYGRYAENDAQSKNYEYNALCKTNIPSISVSESNATSGDRGTNGMRVLLLGSSRTCRVYRPALLGNDGKRIPVSEWRNREG